MSRSTTSAITLRILVSGSCMETRLMPLMPSVLRRKLRNSGSMPMRLIRLDSLGVTWEMIEVRMASRRRVRQEMSRVGLDHVDGRADQRAGDVKLVDGFGQLLHRCERNAGRRAEYHRAGQ